MCVKANTDLITVMCCLSHAPFSTLAFIHLQTCFINQQLCMLCLEISYAVALLICTDSMSFCGEIKKNINNFRLKKSTQGQINLIIRCSSKFWKKKVCVWGGGGGGGGEGAGCWAIYFLFPDYP